MMLKMYDHFNLRPQKAREVYVYSEDGKRYLDTFAGIGVLTFGHSYPELLRAVKNKMDKYMHISNYILDEDAEYVAKRLVEFTGKDGKVFFTNSGTESAEAALKAVKKCATKKRKKIIYFKNGFHGRTLGALSINGIERLRKPFGELLPSTVELSFNDVEEFNDYMDSHGEEVLAVFFEPIQGAGGIIPMDQEFSDVIKGNHERYKFILVSDEIQAGLGRTGKIYAYQHYGLDPDIIIVAKALGGGLPLGAAIFLKEAQNILKRGDHGSTFAPNPVSAAGARYVVDHIEKLLPSVREKGEYFVEEIKKINSNRVVDIRGKGLMIGIELDKSYTDLKQKAFERGLLLNIISNYKVIRLLPALIITHEEIDEIVRVLKELIC